MQDDIKKLVAEEVKSIKEEEGTENKGAVAMKKPYQPPTVGFAGNSAMDIIGNAKDKILDEAETKINKDKIIKKHAEKLSTVADDLMRVETEKAAIEVEKRNADNKAEKQEIENRLIVLKNEAKRLRKDEKFKNKLQRIEIKNAKKQKRWEELKDTLTPLGYTYVPNVVALNIILMLVGLKAFFNGLEKVGTAVLRCFKWLIILTLVFTIVMAIPVTRNWILELLGFIQIK